MVPVIPSGPNTFSCMKTWKSLPEVRSTMTAARPKAVLL